MTSPHDNLPQEVLSLCDETLFKYIPEPSNDDILADLLNSLKIYKNSSRWKEYWRTKNSEKIKNSLNTDLKELKKPTEDQPTNPPPPGIRDLKLA